MAQQRRHVKHTATFEELLAEEAIKFKEPLKSNLSVAWPENCFCGVPGRPRRPLTSVTGCGPPSCNRLNKAKHGVQNERLLRLLHWRRWPHNQPGHDRRRQR